MLNKVININIVDLNDHAISFSKYNNAARRNDLVAFYHTFIKAKYCKWKISTISIPLTIILLIMSIFLWILRSPSLYGAKNLSGFFTVSWVVFVLGWVLPLGAFIYKINLVQTKDESISHDDYKIIFFLQRVCVISGVLSTGLLLLARAHAGACDETFPNNNWRFFMSAGCNPEASVDMIPQDQAVAVIISPMFAHLILKSNKDVVFISYLISFVSLLFTTIVFNLYQSLWICAFGLSTLLCAYEVFFNLLNGFPTYFFTLTSGSVL